MSNTAGRGRGPMGRRRGMSGEKAKNFKGAMLRLLKYMERYKFRLILMVIFVIMMIAMTISIIKLTRQIRQTQQNVEAISQRIANLNGIVGTVSIGVELAKSFASKSGFFSKFFSKKKVKKSEKASQRAAK